MKAYVLERAEGVEGAALTEVPRPEPGPGEVRVRLAAAGLNHRELWILRGLYPGMVLPCILGADGAGVVEALGAGTEPGLMGREVVLYPACEWGGDPRFPGPGFHLLGMPAPGTFAEAITVDAAAVAPVPEHLDMVQAAVLPTAALTAWRGLSVKAALAPGEVLLVTGVGGGVGGFALQFGVAMGARVFVTSSNPQTLAQARDLGAEAGFDYRDPDWRKAFVKASGGGADVVFDGAPASSLASAMRALRPGARVVIYGSTGGPKAELPVTDLFLRHATIFGTAMGSPDDFRAMLDFVAHKRLMPQVAARFDLADAGAALRFLEDGHGFGKVALTMGGAK